MKYQKKKTIRTKLIGVLSLAIALMMGVSVATTFTSQDESAEINKTEIQTSARNTESDKPLDTSTKKTEYWQVLLGGRPVALMTTEISAKDVVKYIMDKYSEEGATSITLEPEITVEPTSILPSDNSVPISSDSKEVAEKLLTGSVKETVYEVQEGDTLWGIAYENDTDVDTILDTNPEIDPTVIRAGDTISFREGEPDVKVRVVSTVEEEQEIEADIVYEETDELHEGEEEVIQYGTSGSKRVTLSVTRVNGITESSEVLEEVVESEPVATVIRVGTASWDEGSEESSDYELTEGSSEEGGDDSYEEASTESNEEESYSEESSEESASSGETAIRETIVNAAMAQLGIDQSCTQLVSSALEAAGISCWTGPSGFASLGSWTDNPEPGDICIYTSHVALYIGNGQAVHGGWVGDGPRTTAVWGVHLSWPTFLGYIHLDL